MISTKKRNEYLFVARGYAKRKKYTMAKIYLDRAKEAAPLSEMQWWRIKIICSESQFEELTAGISL